MTALIETFCEAFAGLPPDVAVAEAERILDELTPLELAALSADWAGTWARPNQLLPDTAWRSYGFFGARRRGKTRAAAEYVNQEAESGRAMRIGFMAQNEEQTLAVMVNGEAGLIACSPPWFKASWEGGRVLWPNGAQAFPFTPERPGALRGPGVHLFWASELQSWPRAHQEEAFANATILASLGYARVVWDATAKRRHPVLRMLLTRAQTEPDRHVLSRGDMYENEDNLGDGMVVDLDREIGKTQRGAEEIRGEQHDEAEGALWKADWIDSRRRALPTKLLRRVIAIDPAMSTLEGTDATGMVEAGLDVDKQVHVLADHTDRHEWLAWAALAVKLYAANECDLIIAERNKGYDAIVANLRTAAGERGMVVVTIDEKAAVPPKRTGVVHVREVKARPGQGKEERALPVAAEYKLGHVSHTNGAELEALETELTTWDPAATSASPNRLDALVYAVWELRGLGDRNRRKRGDEFKGLKEANAKLSRPVPQAPVPVRGLERKGSAFVIRGGGERL